MVGRGGAGRNGAKGDLKEEAGEKKGVKKVRDISGGDHRGREATTKFGLTKRARE